MSYSADFPQFDAVKQKNLNSVSESNHDLKYKLMSAALDVHPNIDHVSHSLL